MLKEVLQNWTMEKDITSSTLHAHTVDRWICREYIYVGRTDVGFWRAALIGLRHADARGLVDGKVPRITILHGSEG